MFKKINHKNAFTLVELLIVIAVIAILAAVVFVALDPLTRFRDARNARRYADISAILSALRVNQVDNGGRYISAIAGPPGLTNDVPYMIGTNSGGSCVTNTPCAVAITNGNCVDLAALASSGYLGKVPVSPNGDSAANWGDGKTGYVLTKQSNNAIKIDACESEGAPPISVTR